MADSTASTPMASNMRSRLRKYSPRRTDCYSERDNVNLRAILLSPTMTFTTVKQLVPSAPDCALTGEVESAKGTLPRTLVYGKNDPFRSWPISANELEEVA